MRVHPQLVSVVRLMDRMRAQALPGELVLTFGAGGLRAFKKKFDGEAKKEQDSFVPATDSAEKETN